MSSENFGEECLLKETDVSELSLKISKLTFGWNNSSEPIKEAHELLEMVRKFALEISEYEHREDSKFNEYQINVIYNSMEDLEKLISYMKNKIGTKYNNDNSYDWRIGNSV